MIEKNRIPLIDPGTPYKSLGEKAIQKKKLNGNIYKSPFKVPDTGIEANICHYPIRLDVYGNGCGHDCTYCYSKSINHFFQRWDKETPLEADLSKLRSLFYKVFETDKKDPMRKHFQDFIPIRLGGMTDLFQPVEKDRKLAFELLKLLNRYDYPAIVVTKGSAILNNNEYIKLLSEGNYIIQVTITTLRDNYSKISEPGAILSSERIKLIRQLKIAKIPVQGRVSPLFPIVPIGSKLDDENAPRLNYFAINLIENLIEAGAFHIIVEFLRLSGFCRNFIRNSTGIDLYEFYTQKNSSSLLSYRQYPLEDKINLFTKIKEVCLKNKVGFSVCPDEGDDPNMDTTINCCGTDNVPGFESCANQNRLNEIKKETYKSYQEHAINVKYWN